ncbi:4-alpha-glucanotransferase [Entamoeba marina]
MKVHILIDRLLPFGHSIVLHYDNKKIQLSNTNSTWSTTLSLTESSPREYWYVEFSGSQPIRTETFSHLLPHFTDESCFVELRDQWNDNLDTFFPKFFKDVVYCRKEEERSIQQSPAVIVLRCKWQNVPSGQSLYVCGSHELMGNWNPAKGIKMQSVSESWWEISIPIDQLRTPFEYKYFMKRSEIDWEVGENRIFAPMLGPLIGCSKCVVYQEDIVNFVGAFQSCGVKVSLAGIVGNGCGCGDILDIKKLCDLCVSSGIGVLELLPLNDTHGNCHTPLSFFAIDPLYIHLDELCKIDSYKQQLIKAKNELKSNKWIDRKKILDSKLSIIQIAFKESIKDYSNVTDILLNGKKSSNPLEDWVKQNKDWLLPYVVYKCGGSNTAPTLDNLKKKYSSNKDLCLLHVFIQYTLYSQLINVAEYAKQSHIGLSYILPFSVSHDSVETWDSSKLFYS